MCSTTLVLIARNYITGERTVQVVPPPAMEPSGLTVGSFVVVRARHLEREYIAESMNLFKTNQPEDT